ncbi:MAG: nickel-type superoxide dismutase maturation protease [Thermoplasmata archaeon]
MMSPLRRFRIRDRSMEPTLREGDQVIASPLPYLLGRPSVGDLVVLRHPYENRFLVKRISEVDGSRISIVGDNRRHSTDSRDFGPVSPEHIVGKVLLRLG